MCKFHVIRMNSFKNIGIFINFSKNLQKKLQNFITQKLYNLQYSKSQKLFLIYPSITHKIFNKFDQIFPKIFTNKISSASFYIEYRPLEHSESKLIVTHARIKDVVQHRSRSNTHRIHPWISIINQARRALSGIIYMKRLTFELTLIAEIGVSDVWRFQYFMCGRRTARGGCLCIT